MRALFDVNVLIALLDRDHLHHARALAWLNENIDAGWASCPLTQNGCLRILSQPAYPNPIPLAAVAERLAEAAATPHHVFWPDAISMLDGELIEWGFVLGSRQVADVYLLALAVAQDGRLVTLDRTVPLILPWDETFDIGSDTGTPVDDKDYQVPFAFNGNIKRMTIALDPPKLTPDDIKKLQEAEAKANDRQ